MRLARVVALALCMDACASYVGVPVELPPNTVALVDAGQMPSGFEEAVPFYRHGHRRGLAIRRVVRGSLVERLGLLTGDIIREIAGSDCDDLLSCRAGSEAMDAAMRARSDFTLIVERDGARYRYTYHHARFDPIVP